MPRLARCTAASFCVCCRDNFGGNQLDRVDPAATPGRADFACAALGAAQPIACIEGPFRLKGRRPHLLLLVAFAGSFLASVVPIWLSFAELSSLRASVQQINEAAAASRQARAVGEKIAAALSDFAAFVLDLDPVERQLVLSATDKQVSQFNQSVLTLKDAMAPWLDAKQSGDLARAARAIGDSWEEIRRQSGNGLTEQQKAVHFRRLIGNVRKAQTVLRAIETRTSGLADVQSKLVFERLGIAASLLVGAIAVGFLISSFGSLSIFHSLEATRKANAELHKAKGALRTRTEQLTEAHRLGKMSDWHMLPSEGAFRWSAEAYRLIGRNPDTFTPTFAAVHALFVDDGLQRVVDSQREVLRSGTPKSIDIKLKRGDGFIGDFTLTSKALIGRDGLVEGFFGTVQDISDRKAAEEQLEAIAYYDPLTGLANRALFSRHIDEVLDRATQSDQGSALLLLDLDRFKEVNDALGHAAGDELLVRVGHLISRVLGNRHFVARLGGDEFAIVIDEQLDKAALEALAKDLIGALSGIVALKHGEVSIGTSIGIVTAPEFGRDATELLRNADLALYRAKEDGRGRYVFFTPDMDTAMQYKLALAKDLRRALSSDTGLSTHFQPQLDLATGRVVGFEALLRWTHPERGVVPPSEFVPIAESSSLICELGNWILRRAAVQAKNWLDAGLPPREVAVNVSAAQIWNSDFVGEVSRVLAETGLPPHLLCLELTESLMADHSEGRVRGALKALKALGVTLALDDFGTHYSSLGYLAQLPIDKLKIDRVFVHGVAHSHRSRELLTGIIALGRGLGMTVLAEGAETSDEVEILRAAGCDQVQGHVFSRATGAGAAVAFAERCDNGLAYAAQAPAPAHDRTDGMVASLRTASA